MATFHVSNRETPLTLGTDISPEHAILTLMFLWKRWDMDSFMVKFDPSDSSDVFEFQNHAQDIGDVRRYDCMICMARVFLHTMITMTWETKTNNLSPPRGINVI